MICPKCGNQIPDILLLMPEGNFCDECGTEILVKDIKEGKAENEQGGNHSNDNLLNNKIDNKVEETKTVKIENIQEVKLSNHNLLSDKIDERLLGNTNKSNNRNKNARTYFSILGLILVCFLIYSCVHGSNSSISNVVANNTVDNSSDDTTNDTTTNNGGNAEVGQDVTLSSNTYLVVNKDDDGELTSYCSANNNSAILTMIQEGKVYILKSGTKVTVAELGVLNDKVQVADGDDQGVTGYIPTELVK